MSGVTDVNVCTSSRNDESTGSLSFTLENPSNICMARAMVEMNLETLSRLDGSDEDQTNDHNSSHYELVDLFRSDGTCRYCKNSPRLDTPVSNIEMCAPDDWQSDLVSPGHRLSKLFDIGHLTDVTIKFDAYPDCFKAHRLILASASPVFERMFYGTSKEATTGVVTLHNCTPIAVGWVLENLYYGKTEIPNVVMGLMIYTMTQMYRMSGISILCRNFLQQSVSLHNLTDVFQVALTHSEEALLNVCLQKMCSEWPELLKEHIADMTVDLWLYLLDMPVLQTTEVQLFIGLYTWAKSSVQQTEGVATPDRIRSKINKLMPRLRLLSLSAEQFIDHVMPTKIFSIEESSSILLKMRDANAPLLTTLHCSTIPYGRIELSESTMKQIVLNKSCASRKNHPGLITELVLISNLTVSNPILLSKIDTIENSTLKLSQMTVLDSDGRPVGNAKALGATWTFVKPVFLHANKVYSIHIDRVLVNKSTFSHNFCSYVADIKMKGTTGENFLKLNFWPAVVRSRS